MKFNKIKWCCVLDNGNVAKLSWMSSKYIISYYMKANPIHWVEV